MPHFKGKVKGGWKVYDKETGKSTIYQSKKEALSVVKKGYGRKPKRDLDYGTKMFTVDSWKPENLTRTE
tara:strand:- start:1257 stop:1463 length:207 start_codon:yes stop_codon:yes gene_type:complete